MSPQTFLKPSGQLWCKMLAIALPVAAQMVLQAFLGMADVIMVGGIGADAPLRPWGWLRSCTF